MEKKKLRNDMKKIRNGIPEHERQRKSERICNAIIQQVLAPLARNDQEICLLAYMSIHSEVDVTPLLEWGWANGHRVLLPKVMKGTNHLQLYVVNSMNDLVVGAWGIREPHEKLERWTSRMDVMIVPGLAFDRQGGRLGYGAGYYDRLWANWNNDKDRLPIKVAAAFDEQFISYVPKEEHDMLVDIVVTDTGLYQVQ